MVGRRVAGGRRNASISFACRTVQDYYTKRPRGFAFVEFVDQRDAEDAKAELDGTTLDGRCVLRTCTVMYYVPAFC